VSISYMLAIIKQAFASFAHVPGRDLGRSVSMPKTRRYPPHAVINTSSFQQATSSADGNYVEVKVEVEDAFVAVNGFTNSDEEASQKKGSKRRRPSKKNPVETPSQDCVDSSEG
jgi:hypothetical protein